MSADGVAWVSVALLGSVHGVNPAMGWLFAVSLGLQAQSSRAVWGALAPLALGHALAVAAVLALGAAAGAVLPLAWVRWGAAAALIGFGVLHLRSHAHVRWARAGMRVGARELTTWSFLVSSAHGAGLMVLPFVLGSSPAADTHAAHAAGTHGAHGAHGAQLAGVAAIGDQGAAMLATLLHTAGYLAVAGLVAWGVYRWIGLRFLRSAWINMNVIWAAALILTAVATVAHGQEPAPAKSQARGAARGTWGFVSTRVDTRSAKSMYVGYGWRGAFVMAGVVHGRAYSEVLGGVGAALETGRRAGHWLAIAAAQTSNGAQAQRYWLPTVRLGAATMRAQVIGSAPLEGDAARELSVSPVAVTTRLRRRLELGVAVNLSAADGARTALAVGPQLRVAVAGANFGVDALRDVSGNASRLRMSLGSVF